MLEHAAFFRHLHELPVGPGLGKQIQDPLHGIFRLQAVGGLADNIHCLGLIAAQEQIIAAGAGLLEVDRREDTLLRKLAV